MNISSDYKKGLSYTAIGEKYNIDRRTAKRYAQSDHKPTYEQTEPKRSKLEPYKGQIDEWLEEAPYSAVRILEKVQEMGSDSKYTIVKQYVATKKSELNEKATVRLRRCRGGR